MATEANDALTKRASGTPGIVKATVGGLFNEDSSTLRRVGIGAGLAGGAGLLVTTGAVVEHLANPQLHAAASLVAGVSGPGALPSAIAAGTIVVINSAFGLNMVDDDHRARRWGPSTSVGSRRAGYAVRARSGGSAVNRIVGVSALVLAGAVGATTLGLDATGIIHGAAATNLTGGVEVLGAAGLTSLAAARAWRASQGRHGELPRAALGE